MRKVVIVIPVYKPKLSSWERRSLIQCFNVLSKYPIVFVCSPNLNLSFYKNIVGNNLACEYFSPIYFSNVEGYNRLCLSTDFYYRFSSYEYMLIYQLDAWVFNDQLIQWCNLGYDYIGAPWFYPNSNEFGNCLNGGFSLRKISTMINRLTTSQHLYSFKSLLRNIRLSSYRSVLSFPIKCLGFRNTFSFAVKDSKSNEDFLWTDFLSQTDLALYLPKMEVTLKFAFESHPELLYESNSRQLPFGCHAFEKYSYDSFWSRFIK